VPKVLLRLHMIDAAAKRGSEQVYCFDKKFQKCFPSNIRGVFASTRFNEVRVEGTVISLEEPLTKIEGDVAPIFERLVERKRLRSITLADRRKIASFCAVQLVRTQTFREQIKDALEGTAQALRKRGVNPADVKDFENLTDDQIKQVSLDMLSDAPETYGPHFMSKYWHLIGAEPEDPFHLGDNPVVLDNDSTHRAPGTVGLASPGATVYLPLSATLCLAMTDRRLMAKLFSDYRLVEKNYKKIKKIASRAALEPAASASLEEQGKAMPQMRKMLEPLFQGTPSESKPEVVMRVNSLQMLYAGRWIVSSTPNFSLPLRMIAENPEFRERQKITVY
jgi:hypothetical protein